MAERENLIFHMDQTLCVDIYSVGNVFFLARFFFFPVPDFVSNRKSKFAPLSDYFPPKNSL